LTEKSQRRDLSGILNQAEELMVQEKYCFISKITLETEKSIKIGVRVQDSNAEIIHSVSPS